METRSGKLLVKSVEDRASMADLAKLHIETGRSISQIAKDNEVSRFALQRFVNYQL